MATGLHFQRGLQFILLIFIICPVTSSASTDNFGLNDDNTSNDTIVWQMTEFCKNATDPVIMGLCADAQIHIHGSYDNCTRLPPPLVKTLTTASDLEALLNRGSEWIQGYPNVKEAILILGNTGSGKTTLAQILTGNLSSIHAVKTQSGSLVIVDDEDKIGAPSTVSKTLIPELIQLPRMALYDCPGFDDTRGGDEDIAANFFMNQIVKKVSSVKMLFLVIHSSVKHGNDRLDFDLLTGHASRFVKNLPKYGNSIGLVVTKVKSYSELGAYLSDEDIMNGIVEFISTFNQTLHSTLASDSENLRKIEFVNILLQTNENQEYSRISFLRSVEKCGPLSESTVVLQSKERVASLVHRILEWTQVSPRDFGYSLKVKTSLSILQLTERHNHKISKNIQILLEHFQKRRKQSHLSTGNIAGLLEKAQRDFLLTQNLLNATNELIETNSSGPSEFLRVLATHLEMPGFSIPSKFRSFMEEEQDFFDFFDEAVGSRLKRTAREWATPIQSLHSLYTNQRDWLDFCRNLQSALNSYRSQAKVKKLLNLQVSSFAQLDIEFSTTQTILNWLAINKVFPVPKRILSIEASLDGHHHNVLRDLTKFGVSPTLCRCTGTDMRITGKFVILSEFVNKTTGKLKINCAGGNATKLEVYASRTIFIDTDLRMIGSELDLVLVAPTWQVVGKRIVLNLSGSSATDIQPSQAANGKSELKSLWELLAKTFFDEVGSDGETTLQHFWELATTMFFTHPGADGENGRPGDPGGPSGSFFGVAGTISNGNELEIVTNGGDGGRGQDGGNGERGNNGLDDFSTCKTQLCRTMSEGRPGGNGGDGGKGGLGGKPGKSRVISLNSNTVAVKLQSQKGRRGRPGKGGEGGEGGLAGKGESCSMNEDPHLDCTSLDPELRASSGKAGEPNSNGSLGNKPRPINCTISEWRSVLNFRKFLFEREEDEGREFTEMMGTSGEIQKYFNVKVFYAELMDLEEISLRETISRNNLELSYKSYKNRVESYFEENWENLKNGERNVVALLLVSASSKISSLRDQAQDLEVVPDLNEYLANLKVKLERWENTSEALEQVDHDTCDEKVKSKKAGQINGFIADVLKPAFEREKMVADSRLTYLGRQFVRVIEENVTPLRSAREKETLRLNGVLNVVQLGIRLLSYFEKSGLAMFMDEGISLVQASNMSNESITMVNMLKGPKRLKRNKAMISLGNGLAALFDKYQNDTNKLSRLESLVGEAESMVVDLKRRKVGIERSFVPVVEKMKAHFNNTKNKFESGKLLKASEPEIAKWGATGPLREIREELQILANGINARGSLLILIELVKDAFMMMVELYNKVEECQSWKDFADKKFLELRGGDEFIEPDLEQMANELKELVKENILRGEIQLAMHAFTQWIFPFAKLELSQFQPIFGTKLAPYLARIDKLQSQLERYKGTHPITDDIMQIFIKANFSSEQNSSSEPFFVWKNDKFKYEIGGLLSGKQVHLKADVRKSTRGRDAIKFSRIEINLKISANNSTTELETELEDELENFSVSMTHGGLSWYRFQRKFFPMTGPNRTIVYNFERDSRGNRIGGNELYRKMESGDFLLSPYTTWTLQLNKVPASNNNTVDFDRLQKFVPQVDVELIGSGLFINSKGGVKEDLKLDKYYFRDDSLWDEPKF